MVETLIAIRFLALVALVVIFLHGLGKRQRQLTRAVEVVAQVIAMETGGTQPSVPLLVE
jgi:hypothetical protein